MRTSILLIIAALLFHITGRSQQITRDQLIALTPDWHGARFDDGRPKVSDSILDRMKLVTLEEAWAVLRNENFKHQFDGEWKTINPDSVLVGRAVTAIFMPGRPDIHRVIDKFGIRDKRVKSQNSWPIDLLVKRDVYVVDQFDAY